MENFENSGHPVFQGVSPLGLGNFKKRNKRETIHFNGEYANITCCTGLFMPRTSSVSTAQSQSGVDRIPEMQAKADPKAFARCPQEFKKKDLKSLVDIPRLPHASGNRMFQNLTDFNSMPFMSKIEYLRRKAKFYHPIEKGNFYVTTTHDDAQKPRGFKAVRIN